LTARDLGALGLKLMGAFFAASATIRLLALVTAMAALPVVNGLDARTLFRVNGFGFLAELAIASVLVIRPSRSPNACFRVPLSRSQACPVATC
jgi:hypothetical protein